MSYDTSILPPTSVIRTVIAQGSAHDPDTKAELSRILAHCLIRDEVERVKALNVSAQTVDDLSLAIHRWIARGTLSLRTANVLFNAAHFCMADVWTFNDAEFLRVKNLGRKCLTEINDLRAAIGPVSDAELSAARAKRPTYKEARAAFVNRAQVTP